MKKSIKIQNISKSFPGVKANSNVSFDIDSGSIHAVVGENGAGKSTLMKILYGMIKPDSGDIYVFDEKISLSSPKDAIKYGLGMVHQHFMLADNFTVLESIILGIDSPGIGNLKLEKYKDSLQEVMKRYSLNVDLDQYVDDLGVGEKQRVEILKVLFRGAKILILDEPTAVLVPQEVDELFKNLKDLQNNGVTIIFISHKLDEVIKIADQITVMRGGEIIGTVDADQVNKKQLAYLNHLNDQLKVVWKMY
jgi:simple sugar transport system ATP-binding protein